MHKVRTGRQPAGIGRKGPLPKAHVMQSATPIPALGVAVLVALQASFDFMAAAPFFASTGPCPYRLPGLLGDPG